MDNNEDTKKGLLSQGNVIVFGFLVILQVAFLIIVVMVFRGMFEEEPISTEVGIDNIQSMVGDESLVEMDETLASLVYSAISENSDDLGNAEEFSASVREGTVVKKEFDKNPPIKYMSFVVDVPVIRQSYKFYYEYEDVEEPDMWGNNIMDLFVTCVSDEEAIYEFECDNSEGGNRRARLVKSNLQYLDNEDFYAYIDEGDLSRIKIVSRSYEHSPEQDAKYVEEVKEFVESLGIPVELFEYYIVPVDEIEIL